MENERISLYVHYLSVNCVDKYMFYNITERFQIIKNEQILRDLNINNLKSLYNYKYII